MRTSMKNKQKLRYALYRGREAIPVTDDDNEIVYGDDGEPRKSGSYRGSYGRPTEFFANIAFAGGEAEAVAYGVSVDAYDSKIVLMRDELPLTETSLIFQNSKPKYRKDGSLDEKSADFRVIRKAPSLNYTVYLLKRIEK